MSFLDLIFPKNCLGCNKEGNYICRECLLKVRTLPQACPYCERASIDGFTHTRCRREHGLDGLTSVWKYEGVIKKAIWALKFKYATEIATELQSYIVTELKKIQVPNNYCLVPIPIHWYRENVRGFNQSKLIGIAVAEGMGWKFEPNLLIKKRPTASQVELSVKDRKKNLKDVFTVSSHNSLFIIPDSVLLFDDVFTTGSTLHEAAKTLKKAGAAEVWGMTIAR